MTWTATRHKVSAIFILYFFSAVLSFGQAGTSSLRGTILDPNGSVVPNAEITLTSPDIGVTLNAHSDKNGFYQFSDVRPATYSLSVSAAGFANYKQNGLVLLVSTPASRDVQLQIASGSTTVEVLSLIHI